MNEITRALVIVGVVGLALIATALWAARAARSRRRAILTEALRPWPAVVLFTSTDCDACDPVRALVHGVVPGAAMRELAYQGNAERFRSAGVEKVPVVVVINGVGDPVGVFEGPVTGRQIGRALRRAGIR